MIFLSLLLQSRAAMFRQCNRLGPQHKYIRDFVFFTTVCQSATVSQRSEDLSLSGETKEDEGGETANRKK